MRLSARSGAGYNGSLNRVRIGSEMGRCGLYSITLFFWVTTFLCAAPGSYARGGIYAKPPIEPAIPIAVPSCGLAAGNEPPVDETTVTIAVPVWFAVTEPEKYAAGPSWGFNMAAYEAPITDTAFNQAPPAPSKTVLYVAFEKGSGFIGDCIDNICDGAYCHAELNLRYALAYRCHLQGNDKLIDPGPYDDGWTMVPVELNAAEALAWCQARDNSVYNLAGAIAFLPRKWGWNDFADWIERLSRKGQVFCSESVAEICNDCGGPNFGVPEDIDPDTLFKALKIATDLPILTGTEYEAQLAPK